MTSRPSRRDFIKLAGLGLGSLAIPFRPPETVARLPQFPQGDRLGRVAVTPNFYSTALRSQPTEGAPTISESSPAVSAEKSKPCSMPQATSA